MIFFPLSEILNLKLKVICYFCLFCITNCIKVSIVNFNFTQHLPDVLADVAGLVLAMKSLWKKNSFSEGAEVRGTRFLFLWLKSGTDPKPEGKRGENMARSSVHHQTI